MARYEPYSWIAKLSNLGTGLFTSLAGRQVGKDAEGNRYFTEKKAAREGRTRRWVVYNGSKGRPEASRVPADWYGWLHHTNDAPLSDEGRAKWIKPHQPNLTFTDEAYRPPGHFLQGGKRAPATGDYQPWKPE